MSKQTKAELANEASAILKRAHCDARSGAKKDKQYRRNKSAQNKRFGRHWRDRRKKLGKFGAASPVRSIPPEDC
jgi:hypothetical protein